MASAELEKRIKENFQWVEDHPTSFDIDVIDANVQLAEYALKGEKEVGIALDLCKRTKPLMDNWVARMTDGHTFWQAEHVAQIEQKNYPFVDLAYRMYKIEAPYLFESYLFYMERDRKYEKRFYIPRRCTLKTVVDDLQRLENDELDLYGLSLPARTGKALADDTPVLTRNGWKKHGDLVVGDEVIGLDGKFKKVLFVFPKCKMEYCVTYGDGEEIVCHGKHEWVVSERIGTNSIENVVETETMLNKGTIMTDGHRRYSAPRKDILVGEEKELAVDPYTLGVWLGDGTNTNPTISNPLIDKAIIDKIVENGSEISWHSVHKTTGVHYYGIKGLRQKLREYDMCHSHIKKTKHIPQEYLTASAEQRLALLAGLLDTDGSLVDNRRYHFSTTEEQLRDDMVSLISTFGWRTCVVKYNPRVSSSGVHGRKPVYVIGFNPDIYIPCQVERKQLHEFSKQRRIGIEKIERIEDDIQGNCITVEDGVYCVGRTLKPTHNSTMGVFFLTWVGYKKPNSHSAAGGHSGMLAKRIFKGYVDLVSTPEYRFTELFSELHPEYKKPIEKISSDPAEFTVNLGDPDAFATISCRGADASWTGVIDISGSPNQNTDNPYDISNDIGYLYVDDLVRDREHSMSASRMENTYQEYLNKMRDRCNDRAKVILIATRWNVDDVIGREERQNIDNPRALFRKIPALDEDDKSNFRYEYHGFSSKYYIEMRDKLDKPEWCAKYMQEPFVREGLLYPIEQLRFFDGNVPDEKKSVIAALDPAFGKGDFLSMPICFDYGDTEKYIVDWIYDSRTTGFTVPEIVDKIEEHFIMELTIEKNNGGDLMADNIEKEMDARGVHHCRIIRKSAPVKMHKEDKISGYADYAKRNFKFLSPKKWTDTDTEDVQYKPSTQYRKALDDLVMYSPEGKQRHDDSPDSIAQLAMVFDGRGRRRVSKVISSPI